MKYVSTIAIFAAILFQPSISQAAGWATAARGALGAVIGEVVGNIAEGRPLLQGTGGAAIGGAVEGVVGAVLEAEASITNASRVRTTRANS